MLLQVGKYAGHWLEWPDGPDVGVGGQATAAWDVLGGGWVAIDCPKAGSELPGGQLEDAGVECVRLQQAILSHGCVQLGVVAHLGTARTLLVLDRTLLAVCLRSRAHQPEASWALPTTTIRYLLQEEVAAQAGRREVRVRAR